MNGINSLNSRRRLPRWVIKKCCRIERRIHSERPNKEYRLEFQRAGIRFSDPDIVAVRAIYKVGVFREVFDWFEFYLDVFAADALMESNGSKRRRIC